MRRALNAWLPLCLALVGLNLAHAQGPSPAKPVATRSVDFIVAVVNSEPITNSEVQQRRLRLAAQWPEGTARPTEQALTAQSLEQLINEKAQLQQARETGIRIDDDAVDLAEMNVARQNQMDKDQLRAKLRTEGLSLNAFREQLREQLTLNRLREREVDGRVRVSESEIDQFLREQRGNPAAASIDLNLAMPCLLYTSPSPRDCS